MTTACQEELRAVSPVAEERDQIEKAAKDLLSRRCATAPHVLARLLRQLGGDADAACEVAVRLTASQRSGQRMLPVPLPLVPSISSTFDALDIDSQSRSALLVIALSSDDRVEVLLPAAGCDVELLLTGCLSEFLTVSRGTCVFLDERMPIWLEHSASALESRRAHRRLAQVHRGRGDDAQAAWHRAAGAVIRLPEIAPVLTAAARDLSERGDSPRAFAMASEAAGHAEGSDRDWALLVAGAAAIGAGCFEDAAERLGALIPGAEPDIRHRALASLLVAEACSHGTIPVLDAAAHRPESGDTKHWRAWARSAGLAAVMCAERGATTAMRGWLSALREAESRADEGGRVSEPAVSLCWTLTGEAEEVAPDVSGPFSGAMTNALCLAVAGDIDGGRRLLDHARSSSTGGSDALIAGFEHSALVDAYLAVTQSLLLFWAGEVETARESLIAASVELPIAAPFAGLGAALARRLDIAVTGEPGPLALALTETLPGGNRIDGLVDRGLSAYLGGAPAQAATDIGLWHDRGAPEPQLGVPGLDEMGPVADRSLVEPQELRDTRELIHRIRLMPRASWRRWHDEIAVAGRALRSPFSRARVEALLGSTCIAHGDTRMGRRHLRAARRLFEDAGAYAWQIVTADRLAVAELRTADPLEISSAAWEALLTSREIDVAVRVADGSENREIATDLGVSVRTVEVHVGRLFEKLGVRNRVELAVLTHRTGLLY